MSTATVDLEDFGWSAYPELMAVDVETGGSRELYECPRCCALVTVWGRRVHTWDHLDRQK